MRPVTDADRLLRANVDSLLAARPDLRTALSLAQGQPAPPPEPTGVPEPAERARINALATDAEHRAYLEQLMADDQELRQGQEADIWAKHGYHSPQADSFTQGLMARDRHDFTLAHYYVQRHGYPGRGRVGPEAASPPWHVFHHTHYPAFQRENFDSLPVAHRRGDLDADQMTLYLGRAYEQRFGERHAMRSPYTAASEIDTLRALLGWGEGR